MPQNDHGQVQQKQNPDNRHHAQESDLGADQKSFHAYSPGCNTMFSIKKPTPILEETATALTRFPGR
jgi:hypothetical protein